MFLTIANKLTICRILIIPFFLMALFYYSPDRDYFRWIALGIFLFAGILDLLDGYIARKFYQETKLGALLDPLADKILLVSAYICLYKLGALFDIVRFPLWFVVGVIIREIILLLGIAVIRFVKGGITIHPTLLGKLTTFCQMLAVLGILVQWHFSDLFWYLVLTLIIVSGFDYMYKGIKQLNSGLTVQC
jgi:cardiolipin synthase